MAEIVARIKSRQGVTTAWNAANPIPKKAEICIEFDDVIQTQIVSIKIGDNVNNWVDLPDLPYASVALVMNLLSVKADLDGSGKILISQLPDTVLGNLKWKGDWTADPADLVTSSDPALNGFSLPEAAATNEGYYLIVQFSQIDYQDSKVENGNITDFEVGDWIVSNGITWRKVDNVDAVKSVNGQRGVVVLTAADVGAEPAFSKNTAFNKNFGSNAGEIPHGNHTHDAIDATGTEISFEILKIYNRITPATGNITDNLAAAKIGMVQKIYHNHSATPTFPAGWVNLQGAYVESELNIIYAEWAGGTRVEYWIAQEAAQ